MHEQAVDNRLLFFPHKACLNESIPFAGLGQQVDELSGGSGVRVGCRHRKRGSLLMHHTCHMSAIIGWRGINLL